jgi:hypothetical protein
MPTTTQTQPLFTYAVTFRHQENNITHSLELIRLTKADLCDAIMCYADQYRSMEAICEQTGEVVMSHYYSMEFWEY